MAERERDGVVWRRVERRAMFTADPSMLLGVNDNRRGTAGQLVGGLVEVQVACVWETIAGVGT
jgi:hypothetical protein